jgi:hypothetical protein
VPPATGLLTSILSGPATGTPTTGTPTTGSMTIPRAFHTLTQLQNGQVLTPATPEVIAICGGIEAGPGPEP